MPFGSAQGDGLSYLSPAQMITPGGGFGLLSLLGNQGQPSAGLLSLGGQDGVPGSGGGLLSQIGQFFGLGGYGTGTPIPKVQQTGTPPEPAHAAAVAMLSPGPIKTPTAYSPTGQYTVIPHGGQLQPAENSTSYRRKVAEATPTDPTTTSANMPNQTTGTPASAAPTSFLGSIFGSGGDSVSSWAGDHQNQLMAMAGAMMSTPGNFGQGIGAGFTAGLTGAQLDRQVAKDRRTQALDDAKRKALGDFVNGLPNLTAGQRSALANDEDAASSALTASLKPDEVQQRAAWAAKLGLTGADAQRYALTGSLLDPVKPSIVHPGDVMMGADGRVLGSVPAAPDLGVQVVNGRIVTVDKHTGQTQDVTPANMPPGARPLTAAEQKSYPGAVFMDGNGTPHSLGGSTTNVNIDQKQEGAAAAAMGAGLGKQFVDAMNDGQQAGNDLGTIDNLRAALRQAPSGFAGGIQAYASQYGINLGPGATAAQYANSIINKLVPAMRVPGSGTTSDRDASMFRLSLPSLMNTPDGNALILDQMQALAERRQQVGSIASQVASGQMSQTDGIKAMQQLQSQSPFAPFAARRDALLKGQPVPAEPSTAQVPQAPPQAAPAPSQAAPTVQSVAPAQQPFQAPQADIMAPANVAALAQHYGVPPLSPGATIPSPDEAIARARNAIKGGTSPQRAITRLMQMGVRPPPDLMQMMQGGQH